MSKLSKPFFPCFFFGGVGEGGGGCGWVERGIITYWNKLISVVDARAFTRSNLLPLSKSKMATVENKIHSPERIRLQITRCDAMIKRPSKENGKPFWDIQWRPLDSRK